MKPKLLCIAFLAFLSAQGDSQADATVVVQSSALSTNLTSGGAPLTSDYTFELGCFTNNFVPTPSNTAEWLLNWVPLSDATGDPIPAATVPYNDNEVGGPFLPGTKVNNFEISAPFSHNISPFSIGVTFYIWGFDNRTEDGASEWILISDPSWDWPEATLGEPTQLTFTVASATTAVIGALNNGNVEMQTASVLVSNSLLPHYEQWMNLYFTPAQLEDENQMNDVWGVLADPDNDNISNLVEYLTGTSPVVGISLPQFSVWIDEGLYYFKYDRLEDAPGAIDHAEWSTDLANWHTTGIIENIVPGDEGMESVISSILMPEDGRIFMRLQVERVLD